MSYHGSQLNYYISNSSIGLWPAPRQALAFLYSVTSPRNPLRHVKSSRNCHRHSNDFTLLCLCSDADMSLRIWLVVQFFGPITNAICQTFLEESAQMEAAFDLPPLSGPYVAYAGPQDHADPCICSTVLYSLMSACAYCQNASYFNWSTFHVNCTVVYPQVFPSPLPSSIVVPHYAYLDVVTNDTFDVTAAMSASGLESSPVPQSTTPTNPTVTSTPILTPSTSVASSSKKLNAGAIAGGVVGGVVGIIIVAGLISAFVVLRCLKRQSAPQYMMDDGAG